MCLRRDPVRSFFISFSGFLVYFTFAFNYPSLKEEVESKGISQSWTGIILGVYSVPSLFYWIFFDKLVHRYGRKCMLLSGLYTFLISLFLFGLIELAEASFFFIFAGILTRFLVGLGSFQHKSVLYSVATKKYPDSLNKVFAYISMAINLGIGVAGFMGSITYENLGKNLFYINTLFAGLFLIAGVPMTHYLLTEPTSQTKKYIPPPKVDTFSEEKTISLKYLICDCKIAAHFLIIFWYTVQQNFWMTSLRKNLSQELDQSESFIGMAYLSPGIAAMIVIPFAPLTMKRIGRPNTVIIGCVLNLLGYIFLGPIQFLPNEAYLVMIGLIFEGFGYPFFYLPTIPQIISNVMASHPDFYIGPVTDKASSLAYFCMDSGAIIGTVTGDLTYNAFGFRRMVLIFMFIHIFVMIVFCLFGKGGRVCRIRRNAKIKVKQSEESTPSSSRKLKFPNS